MSQATTRTARAGVEAGHAPGPWYADPSGHVWGEKTGGARPGFSPYWYKVADVAWHAPRSTGGGNPEYRANIRLICASPDLLDACRDLLNLVGEDHPAAVAARRAIRKAEGEVA